ncbi:uncharacterized protein N7459_008316 [Penicillium hispanicum]|uniref:uncharacterized protein n=1 Tax=Penicillium hispanicum TaxID=1080232 RepID=UPI00253F8E92|nr:uncharacterized protein N7459_008316 [Penicillium hispanicum]KAJ5573889.1 hypothetical protein N7459_008316 [Penicillium hispanicum]
MTFAMFAPPTTILRLGLGLGIGLSAAALHPLSPFRVAPIQCQYSAPYYRPETQANSETGWAVHPNDPLLSKQGRTGIGAQARGGFMNADNMRQISLGSVLGLVAGVGLRAFSKALVVILGMGVVLIEWAASKGYNILPLHRIQKYVKRVDLQRAVSEHRPFKISFGAMMALAAFAQF